MAALLGLLLAVPAANLDALLAGHRHETASGVVHHRHLHAGAHEHPELAEAGDHEAAVDAAEDDDEHGEPGHERPDERPPGSQAEFTASVLLLVEAGPGAPRLPGTAATRRDAAKSRHSAPARSAPRYLPTTQRPPPSV